MEVVLLIFFLVLVLLHAMIALLASVMLTGVVVADYVLGRAYRPDANLVPHASILPITAGMGVLSTIYVFGHEIPEDAIRETVLLLLYPTLQGRTTADKAGTLTELGISPVELVLRIAGIDILLTCLAALIVVVPLTRWARMRASRTDWILVLLGASLVPVAGAFVLFVLAGFRLYFRVMGIIMVVVTVVVGIRAAEWYRHLDSRLRNHRGRAVVAVVVSVLLFISLSVILPSPYIMQSSGHVTEAEVTSAGFASAHGISVSQTEVVRADFSRLVRASMGEDEPTIRNSVPDHFNDQNLPAAYDSRRYLFKTTEDYRVDTDLYREFRYSAESFDYLDTDPGLHRLTDAGDATIYEIEPRKSQ